jgi:hypothetical protein
MRTSIRAAAAPGGREVAAGIGTRLAAALASAGVAAAPAILTYVLVHAWLGAQLGDFVPNFWNDQVGYWHRIASFSEVAFDTGYYTPSEVDVPFEPIRYGVNGPWFPAVYGSIAAIIGWGSATSIYVNMAVLALGLIVFIVLTRPDLTRLLLTGVAVAVVWPVLLYVPTASQESLHQAIAIVLAGIFMRALHRGPGLSTREKVAGVSFLAVVSVLRFSWAILLPCLILLYARRPTRRAFSAALGAGALVLFLATKLTSALQPPGQNAALDALNRLTREPADSISLLADTTWENAKLFLYPGALDPTAPPVAIRGSLDLTGVQSWEIVALSVLALLAAVASWRRSALLEPLRVVPIREALFHLVNLGVMTGAALTLYLPTGYYRVLGAHLLLSVLVLVASRRVAVVLAILAANLIMLPSFLNAYERWTPNFTVDQATVARERAGFATLIEYDPSPRNPWCNTLLMPVEVYDWRVTLVPRGIGIAYALSAVPSPPKSRYVLLTADPFPLNSAVDTSRLIKLGSFTAGTLFLNPDSQCHSRSTG